MNSKKKVEKGYENEYAISSAFAESLLLNPNCKVIIYPSVQTNFKGYNIVLNPIDADEYLQLNAVLFGALYKFGQVAPFNNFSNAELKDGIPFRWKQMDNDATMNNDQLVELLLKEGVGKNEIIKILFEQIKRMKHN